MRILIGGFGTRGDVQPMVALAQTLKARGHTVTLGVPPESAALARAHGLEPIVAGLNYEALSRRAASGKMKDVLPLMALLRGEIRAQLEALEGPARRADLIVGSSVFGVGTVLSEALQRPYVFIALCPVLVDSSTWPPPIVPFYHLPRWLNRVAWWVTGRLWNLVLLPPVNAERRARGLARTRDVWRSLMGLYPMLATDPTLAPAPTDHRNPVTQLGPLFLADASALTDATRAFLEAGPPPVYLGFGSMSDPDPGRTTQRLLESVRRAGVRAIVSRGWAGLTAGRVPEGVHFAGPEPHAALFPRCLGVVHHGGAGTTQAAARAGVPQVVMPQILDQFFWRERLLACGVSPMRVPRYSRDPEPLARALRALASDPALRERAQQLATRLVQDGTARAVEALERVAREGRPTAG